MIWLISMTRKIRQEEVLVGQSRQTEIFFYIMSKEELINRHEYDEVKSNF